MHTNQHSPSNKGILANIQAVSEHYLLLDYNRIPVVSHIIFTLKPNELIMINVTTMNAGGIRNDYPLIVKGC